MTTRSGRPVRAMAKADSRNAVLPAAVLALTGRAANGSNQGALALRRPHPRQGRLAARRNRSADMTPGRRSRRGSSQRADAAKRRADAARARLDAANAAIDRNGIGPSPDPNLPLGQVVDGTARAKRKAGERGDAQLGRLAQAFRDKDRAERDLRAAEAVYAREMQAVETVKRLTPERLAAARMVKAGDSWYEVGGVRPGAKTVKAKGMDYSVQVARIVDVRTSEDLAAARRERA